MAGKRKKDNAVSHSVDTEKKDTVGSVEAVEEKKVSNEPEAVEQEDQYSECIVDVPLSEYRECLRVLDVGETMLPNDVYRTPNGWTPIQASWVGGEYLNPALTVARKAMCADLEIIEMMED